MGYATTRVLDRIPSVISKCGATSISFDAHQGLRYGGLMLLIPALISQGLLKSAEVYDKGDDGYYPFETIMLTLALMALARIKNPEQLKNCKHGEMGRILGIDSVCKKTCNYLIYSTICLKKSLNDFQTNFVKRDNMLILCPLYIPYKYIWIK